MLKGGRAKAGPGLIRGLAGQHALRLADRLQVGVHRHGIQRIGSLPPEPIHPSDRAAAPFTFLPFPFASLYLDLLPTFRLLHRMPKAVLFFAPGVAVAGRTLLACSVVHDDIGRGLHQRG